MSRDTDRDRQERIGELRRLIPALQEELTSLEQGGDPGPSPSPALLRIASRMGRLGGWTVHLPERTIQWTDETRAIHELEGTAYPTVEEAIDFYVPEHRAQVRDAFEACARAGTPFDLELELITARGRRLWVRVIGEAVRDHHGTICAVQGAMQDTSEARRANDALRESEARFRLLCRATNDAVWDWDLQTNELWWNEEIETLFGYRRAEVAAIDAWSERVHPDDYPRVVPDLERAVASGQSSWSKEYRFRRNDGSYAYVLDRGHVFYDERGKAVRMIGGMTDLTERKRAEERLAEQAELLEKAQDAILVRDLGGCVVYMNRQAERLYGWERAIAVGADVRTMQFARDPEAFERANEATIRDGEWSGELEQVCRDGSTVLVEGRWTLLRRADDTPYGILAVNTDVSERKRLEQQILRTQRLESIGTLAGGIAHDLNNVLTPILFSVELLRQGEARAERLADLATIEACARRGSEMVGQLLAFARGYAGRRTSVAIAEIVRELERIAIDTFPRSIAFRFACPEALWTVSGDPTQLNQVLMNLCVNARDAMADGGTLTLAAENTVLDEVYAGMNPGAKAGRYVVVRVEDTGCGMTPEVLERIFEPFFTTKEVGKGTGLGLSSTHAIVKSHGGFINVYTEVGKGSRFHVYLPAEAKAAE